MDTVIALLLMLAYFAALGVGGWMVSKCLTEDRGASDNLPLTRGPWMCNEDVLTMSAAGVCGTCDGGGCGDCIG